MEAGLTGFSISKYISPSLEEKTESDHEDIKTSEDDATSASDGVDGSDDDLESIFKAFTITQGIIYIQIHVHVHCTLYTIM